MVLSHSEPGITFLVGLVTLIVCLVSRYLLHGVYKNLNILVGLIFGYILFRNLYCCWYCSNDRFLRESARQSSEIGFFSLPRLVFFTGHTPVFDLGAFCTIAIVFLVSAAETTGATTAVCKGSLDRDIKIEELQGSLAVDGFSSTISGCFGCLPLTSFSQNVGLGNYDWRNQSIHDPYGSFDPDPSISVPAAWSFL